MTDQNRRCDGADTAGNRGDRADNRLNLGEDCVARDGALAALGVDLLGVPVDGDVDDDLVFRDVVLRQAVQNACPFMLFNISEMGSFFWLSLQNFRPKSTKVESEDRKVFT